MFKDVLDEKTGNTTKVCVTDKSSCKIMEETTSGHKCISDLQCDGAIFVDEYNQTYCVKVCPQDSPYLKI